MKKTIAGVIVLAALALAGVVAYQTVERDREYQRLIAQGDAALSRGETFVAIEAFSGAIALKRESMLAYLKRGEAHRHRGDSTETLMAALRDLRTAAELDPGATRPQEALGDVNVELHRYANAIESYETYLQLDDRSAPVFYKLALAARGAGQLTRAVSALRSAVRLNPEFAEGYYLLGLCLKERGEAADAQAALERAIAIAPALIPAREELADLHRLQGRTREEIEQLEAIAALDPRRPERLVAVGLAYSRAKQAELAVTALGRAAERFQDYQGVYTALGRVWLDAAEDRGDRAALRKALEALEPFASRSSATSETLGLYGRALALAGRPDQAEQAFRQAVEKLPIDPGVLTQYAAIAERLGHLEDARSALVRHAALVDDDGAQAAHATRIGDLSLEMNDPAVAIDWYEKAAALAPPDAGLLARLADAQYRIGEIDAASATLARALAKDATNASARALARRLRVVQAQEP